MTGRKLFVTLALLLCAVLLCSCGKAEVPGISRGDIDTVSSARLGGQDAPGDPEGVSSVQFSR
jgi:hypothetical protein